MKTMSKRSLVALALVLSFCAGRVAAEGALVVGDPAPQLEVKEFIKGDEVKKFDKGKVYVVEFWGTWCKPCVKCIPHLTELQKKYKDVTFIGVSAEDPQTVKKFVKDMGDKMDYRVALDANGKVCQSWRDAANKYDSIPRAFIVDGEGRVAWIGHPMRMEDPLKEIVAGKWDLEAAAKAFKASVEKK
jgi:thiol-disulfide isomerase/thioredoxin